MKACTMNVMPDQIRSVRYTIQRILVLYSQSTDTYILVYFVSIRNTVDYFDEFQLIQRANAKAKNKQTIIIIIVIMLKKEVKSSRRVRRTGNWCAEAAAAAAAA